MAVLGGTLLFQYGEIRLIHCQYVMKNLEIFFVYASGTQPICIITSPGCCFLGPLIWRLANVIVVGTRRIDINLVFKTSSFDLMPEYGFRSGGAANIAHTHKQNIRFDIFFQFRTIPKLR
jgi:hypothetical protein